MREYIEGLVFSDGLSVNVDICINRHLRKNLSPITIPYVSSHTYIQIYMCNRKKRGVRPTFF